MQTNINGETFETWIERQINNGQLVRAKVRRDDSIIFPWGISPAMNKYKGKIKSSKRNGIKFNLTSTEYITKIWEAGINPDQIGQSVDSYQLGRIGDGDVPYTVETCRFITKRQNLDERKENGGNVRTSEKIKEKWQDPEYRNTMSEKTKEQWKDPEFRKKVSEKVSGTNNGNWKGWWQTPNGRFTTVKEAAEANGCVDSTIYIRVNNPNFPD
ncbi:hypothetical protein [Endozoicomonas sp. ALB115]|uniref:hypothetical protein n=1 Tax=Endozoicomonas sp. ALB115 TaxID=3403074 RepID=UPI003BB4D4DD